MAIMYVKMILNLFFFTANLLLTSYNSLPAHQLEKLQKAASAAHTYFVANPSHLEMRNNIEKYRRMEGVTEEAFYDREIENEKHWVNREGNGDTVCILYSDCCHKYKSLVFKLDWPFWLAGRVHFVDKLEPTYLAK